MIGRTADTLIQELLNRVISAGASDLHLSVGRPPIIRVDGFLRALTEVPPLGKGDVEGTLRALAKPEDADRYQKTRQEVDFSYQHEQGYRFRVNIYTALELPAIALRVIPDVVRTLAELNLPPDLERFARVSQGLVVIAGPTGHGKTTTMAALVDLVNHTRSGHIITIEDPIEYVYREDRCLIHQREVRNDTASFAQALRMALREDPNVVVVGEMRDLESIATALTIAETGHLVFTTLHTNDAGQTVDRIVDAFPPSQQQQIRVQLAGTLMGIISQRLLPRRGGGRIPALELLIATSAVRNLIREGDTAQIPGVVQTGAASGMMTLDRSLQSLVDRDLVTPEHAALYMRDAFVTQTDVNVTSVTDMI